MTARFTAEQLAPKIAEYTGDKSGKEFKAGLCATLATTAHAINYGDIKFGRSGGKYIVLDSDKPGDGDDAAEADDEDKGDEKKDAERLDQMADEMSALVEQVMEVAKKHAKSKQDFCTTLSSVALTIVEAGGAGAKIGLLIGLEGILAGKI